MLNFTDSYIINFNYFILNIQSDSGIPVSNERSILEKVVLPEPILPEIA